MELYNTNDKIHGVPNGVLYGQHERVDGLNNRMASRQFSDNPLEPNFNIRPVSTKYAHFPTLDRQPIVKEKSQKYENYSLSKNFNPGSDKAPVSGYFSNVDLETNMRNQHFALQHGASQGTYVPTSASELYNVRVPFSVGEPQPHPDLFQKQQFANEMHPNLMHTNIGNDRFFNHTRTQLRNM